METIRVVAYMVDNTSEAFTTGVTRNGNYTRKEIIDCKHHKLIDGINIYPGCKWQFEFNYGK